MVLAILEKLTVTTKKLLQVFLKSLIVLKDALFKVAPAGFAAPPSSEFAGGLNDGTEEIDTASRDALTPFKETRNMVICLLAYFNPFVVSVFSWSWGIFEWFLPLKPISMNLLYPYMKFYYEGFLSYFVFIWMVRYIMIPSSISYALPRWVRFNIVQSMMISILASTFNYIFNAIFVGNNYAFWTGTFGVLIQLIFGTFFVLFFARGILTLLRREYWWIPILSDQVDVLCQKYY